MFQWMEILAQGPVAKGIGILGIILTMQLVRRVFSIDVDLEARNVKLSGEATGRAPNFLDLEVTNPTVDGLPLRDIPFAAEAGIGFSRLLGNGKVAVPEDDSVIRLGDGLRLVGPES